MASAWPDADPVTLGLLRGTLQTAAVVASMRLLVLLAAEGEGHDRLRQSHRHPPQSGCAAPRRLAPAGVRHRRGVTLGVRHTQSTTARGPRTSSASRSMPRSSSACWTRSAMAPTGPLSRMWSAAGSRRSISPCSGWSACAARRVSAAARGAGRHADRGRGRTDRPAARGVRRR